MVVGKLHTKIMQKDHDVLISRQCGNKPQEWLEENVLLAQNERKHRTFCAHLCEIQKHKVHI